MAVLDQCLHEEGYSKVVAAQKKFDCTGLPPIMTLSEHKPVPGKIGKYSQFRVVHRVGICIQPSVLPATRHLLLSGFREIEHGRLVCIVHTRAAVLTSIPTVCAVRRSLRPLTMVLNSAACSLLYLKQQEAIGCCEEGALEDAMLAAERHLRCTFYMIWRISASRPSASSQLSRAVKNRVE